MKIIKMRIKRVNLPNKTSYVYPSSYDAKKIVFGPVYEKDAKINHPAYQDIIFGVRDKDVDTFLAANNIIENDFTFTAVEKTQEEANIDGNIWIDQVEKIIDHNTVALLCAKVARGGVLTKEEKDKLDPDNPAIGVNKSKTFEESLNEAITKF